MTPALEYRSTFEVRADADAGGFSGYAATFNRVDSYGTAFSPDSFKKTLSERGEQIPVLYQHDPSANVGVPEVLKADKTGLAVEARLFDDGADGTVLLKRLRQGARFGMSFGFQTIQSRPATEEDDLDLGQLFDGEPLYDGLRVITEVKLYEVSVVSFPANEAAQITDVRNAAIADALASALEAVRDGSLNERQRELLDAIVAAHSTLSPVGTAAPREPEIARRRLDVDIALARYRFAV